MLQCQINTAMLKAIAYKVGITAEQMDHIGQEIEDVGADVRAVKRRAVYGMKRSSKRRSRRSPKRRSRRSPRRRSRK